MRKILLTIFAIVSQANTLEVEENAIVVPTFESLINEHVRLFIFKKNSHLCGLTLGTVRLLNSRTKGMQYRIKFCKNFQVSST